MRLTVQLKRCFTKKKTYVNRSSHATIAAVNDVDGTDTPHAHDWLGQNSNPPQTENSRHGRNVRLNNEVEQNGNSAWLSS